MGYFSEWINSNINNGGTSKQAMLNKSMNEWASSLGLGEEESPETTMVDEGLSAGSSAGDFNEGGDVYTGQGEDDTIPMDFVRQEDEFRASQLIKDQEEDAGEAGGFSTTDLHNMYDSEDGFMEEELVPIPAGPVQLDEAYGGSYDADLDNQYGFNDGVEEYTANAGIPSADAFNNPAQPQNNIMGEYTANAGLPQPQQYENTQLASQGGQMDPIAQSRAVSSGLLNAAQGQPGQAQGQAQGQADPYSFNSQIRRMVKQAKTWANSPHKFYRAKAVALRTEVEKMIATERKRKLSIKPEKMSDVEFWRSDPEGYAKFQAAKRAPAQPRQLSDQEWFRNNPQQYAKFQAAKRGQTQQQAPEGSGPEYIIDPKARRNYATGLRKEFKPIQSKFTKQTNTYNGMADLAKLGTGAGDTGLVFSFMKILDPGSTVREGEFAQAAKSNGLPDSLISIFSKADTGEILTPDARKKIMNAATVLYSKAEKSYKNAFIFFNGITDRKGINFNNVLYDTSNKTPALSNMQTVNRNDQNNLGISASVIQAGGDVIQAGGDVLNAIRDGVSPSVQGRAPAQGQPPIAFGPVQDNTMKNGLTDKDVERVERVERPQFSRNALLAEQARRAKLKGQK